MFQIRTITKGAFVAVASLALWALSLAVMLGGGFLVAVGTPCLCFDANGFMLGGGLAIILAGAAMLMWSGDLARRLSDRLSARLVSRDTDGGG